jgi:hypothetical protein
MSLNARRYQKKENLYNPERMTRHHVPPRHPDSEPRFVMDVDDRHHRAYHLLFKAAANFEDACAILWEDWWRART